MLAAKEGEGRGVAPKPGGLRAIHTDRSTPKRMNSSSMSRSLIADGRFPTRAPARMSDRPSYA